MSDTNAETVLIHVLEALISTVGVEGIIKIVSKLAGPDKVRAILDAEYAANDVAVEAYEREQLDAWVQRMKAARTGV